MPCEPILALFNITIWETGKEPINLIKKFCDWNGTWAGTGDWNVDSYSEEDAEVDAGRV